MPFLKTYAKGPLPIISEDPKLKPLEQDAEYHFTIGYPGPLTVAADEVYQQFIMVDAARPVLHGQDGPRADGQVGRGQDQGDLRQVRRRPPAEVVASRGILAAMRRPLVALAVAIAVVGGFTGGLAGSSTDPRPPAGARGERLYYAYCAECHGRDGRGSWRAALFLLRPGNLADTARMSAHSDQYLFDIIKHGGSPVGRPGMPAFGYLTDDDIQALVAFLRTLPKTSPVAP